MQSIPTMIYIEKNAVSAHAAELSSYGSRALIVTGGSSKRNGSLDDVTAALSANGVSFLIFNSVEENPSVETVTLAAGIAAGFGAEFIVAVGGGSPMDAAKAAALLAADKGGVIPIDYSVSDNIAHADYRFSESEMKKIEQILYTQSDRQALAVVCVPTTCGTGSEVTPISVLTSHILGTKKSIAYRIFPKLALVDYTYLKTMPYSCLVNTCADALAHMAESYLSNAVNAFSAAYSEKGLRLWGSAKGCLESEEAFRGMTDADYLTFMQASVFAGMSIAYTGTTLPHGLSYLLTYEKGVPHGKAVAVFLPGFIKFYENKSLAERVVCDMLGFTGIDGFRDYIRRLFGELPLPAQLCERNITGLLANPSKLKSYPYPVTAELLSGYLPYYNE